MRYSKVFAKTKKTSATYDTTNATLLVKSGFVNQLMAGVYTYLPLGLRVLNKISDIVREEMDNIGGEEVLMPMLHPSENWKQTGGWDGIDVLFKIKSRTEKDYALGQSEEEVVTPLMKEYLLSRDNLPLLPYQINWKFRDELRAKSGILRGREFLMKDMYSLHENQEEFEKFYAISKKAYLNVFERCGLVAKATEASGGNFTKKISYEFMVLTEAGEDDILYSDNSDYCINTEISELKEGDDAPDGSGKLKKGRASEVGNVFDLGTKYQEAFDMKIQQADGSFTYGVMGCYGLGVSRLMGVIVEKCNDDKGIIWPEAVAPYQVHIVSIGKDGEESLTKANELYEKLLKMGVEVLFDDRQESAGSKLADADLIGIPWRVVVSSRSLENGGYELKKRSESESKIVSEEELMNVLKK